MLLQQLSLKAVCDPFYILYKNKKQIANVCSREFKAFLKPKSLNEFLMYILSYFILWELYEALLEKLTDFPYKFAVVYEYYL